MAQTDNVTLRRLSKFYTNCKTKFALATHSHSAATTSANGFMSSADKTKLNGIATGATKVTVDSALSSTSTNPVQNKIINSALGGKAATTHLQAIANGGTGATTAADALTNLGLTATAEEINYCDGVTSNIQTQLNAKAASSHNHSAANITSGTLAVARGGTGQTTLNDAANSFINSLSTGAATPTDADYYVSQYVGGGTTTTTYHRRPISALWSYIKSKADSVYAAISHVHSVATTSANGFMSSTDKTKLDGIATGATKVTVDTAISSTSTNPVQNKVIYSALSGKAASSHTHAASAITSGILPVSYGGTGHSTHTANAVLTGNGTSMVNNVATASGALYATAASGAAKFGTLPVAQGGTGASYASFAALCDAVGSGGNWVDASTAFTNSITQIDSNFQKVGTAGFLVYEKVYFVFNLDFKVNIGIPAGYIKDYKLFYAADAFNPKGVFSGSCSQGTTAYYQGDSTTSNRPYMTFTNAFAITAGTETSIRVFGILSTPYNPS